MRFLIFYISILAAVVLPFIFRRAYGVRVLSVMVLGAIALLHFTVLMTMRRLVIQDGVRHFGVANGVQLPPGFDAATDSIARISQSQMWLFAALVAALLFLALFPFSIPKGASPK